MCRQTAPAHPLTPGRYRAGGCSGTGKSNRHALVPPRPSAPLSASAPWFPSSADENPQTLQLSSSTHSTLHSFLRTLQTRNQSRGAYHAITALKIGRTTTELKIFHLKHHLNNLQPSWNSHWRRKSLHVHLRKTMPLFLRQSNSLSPEGNRTL